MKAFAQFMHQELNLPGNPEELKDICEGTDRYCMYKVGPVLSISVSASQALSTDKMSCIISFPQVILFIFLHCSMAWVSPPSPSCCMNSSSCCITLSAAT